jgi:hypothetical protein
MAREDGFFDDLARGLADGSLTRGKALRLMGAAVVGSTLGSLGIGEASADPPGCKRNGKNCTRNEQCCSRNCSGGSCQSQTTTTTTTTPTTTTSTTTPTTSTSTSTTSTSTSTTSTTPGCLPLNELCTNDTQCCSEICDSTFTGRCSTCRGPRGVCVNNGCCNSVCDSGICCVPFNRSGCTVNADCCDNLICVDGSCGF